MCTARDDAGGVATKDGARSVVTPARCTVTFRRACCCFAVLVDGFVVVVVDLAVDGFCRGAATTCVRRYTSAIFSGFRETVDADRPVDFTDDCALAERCDIRSLWSAVAICALFVDNVCGKSLVMILF